MAAVTATMKAMLLVQAFRPLTDRCGPAGQYALDTFAAALTTQLEKNNG